MPSPELEESLATGTLILPSLKLKRCTWGSKFDSDRSPYDRDWYRAGVDFVRQAGERSKGKLAAASHTETEGSLGWADFHQ